MLTRRQDFDGATAFERYALARAVPIVASTDAATMTLDLRNPAVETVRVEATDRLFGGDEKELRDSLRPLFFGAAWKILDLLVELSLAKASLRPDKRNGEWTIGKKVAHARAARGRLTPLTADRTLWKSVTALYAATSEPRHALVHRRVNVDRQGNLTPMDRSGQALAPITPEEQEAFCRVSQRAAEAVIRDRGLSHRQRDDLTSQLDILAVHHKQPNLGGQESGLLPIPTVIANLQPTEDGWRVDLADLQARAQATWTDRKRFDLILCLPDGSSRQYRAELETAPDAPSIIDPEDPPKWLKRD